MNRIARMAHSHVVSMDFGTEQNRTFVELEIRFILYAICGAIVLLFTIPVIIVFTFAKEFRTKYAFFNAMAFADFINGLSFLISGIYRYIYLHNGEYFQPVTNSECIWETPYAVLMIVAGQLPAFLNLALAVERVVALEFSLWYRRNWKEQNKHYLIMACIAVTTVLFVFVLYIDKIHVAINPDRMCAVMDSTGIVFGTIHYSVCALIYVICLIVLVVIYSKAHKQKKPTKDERRRQNTLIAITAISVFLVSIPNVALILNEWGIPKMSPVILGITYCLYALHSALSLPVYIYFRPDFRARFVALFLRNKFLCKQCRVFTVGRLSSELQVDHIRSSR